MARTLFSFQHKPLRVHYIDAGTNLVAGKLNRGGQLAERRFSIAKFSVGDRVYHLRKDDPIATEGYGTVLEIGGTRAMLLWEHNGKHGSVERRDLMTELEAAEAGL
jgi:hypothetical protein